MTYLAVLPPIHVIWDTVIVTLTMNVLEIWFVEVTTALLVILAWIAVKVPVIQ